jgi:hypothetical protein
LVDSVPPLSGQDQIARPLPKKGKRLAPIRNRFYRAVVAAEQIPEEILHCRVRIDKKQRA